MRRAPTCSRRTAPGLLAVTCALLARGGAAHDSCCPEWSGKERTMANLNIRRDDPREPLTTIRDPLRTTDLLRSLDPFRMIRYVIGSDPLAGMLSTAGELFAPDVE